MGMTFNAGRAILKDGTQIKHSGQGSLVFEGASICKGDGSQLANGTYQDGNGKFFTVAEGKVGKVGVPDPTPAPVVEVAPAPLVEVKIAEEVKVEPIKEPPVVVEVKPDAAPVVVAEPVKVEPVVVAPVVVVETTPAPAA